MYVMSLLQLCVYDGHYMCRFEVQIMWTLPVGSALALPMFNGEYTVTVLCLDIHIPCLLNGKHFSILLCSSVLYIKFGQLTAFKKKVTTVTII